jgi:molybdate transport system substrate-binding protein
MALAGACSAAVLGLATTSVAAPTPLLISAAVSLSEPLQALAAPFAAQRRVPLPRFNLASSGVLQQQIQNGAPVDVFISAGRRQMEALEQRGLLLTGTRRDLAGNQLVLVVPARSPRRPLSFAGLGSRTVERIAIGDSTVPAGDYARQVLAHYRLTEAVEEKLVPLASVRAVAQAVAAGNVDAGIIYRSDALSVANLRVTDAAPEASHAPIRYSGAVVRSSRQPALARAYLDFLSSPAAQPLLRRLGFTPLPAATRT